MFTADDIKAIRSGTGGAGASSSASSQGFTAADIKKIRSQINMAELNPAPKVAAPKISTPAAPQQTFAAPKTEATPQQKAVHERVLQLAANSNAPKSTVQELRSGRDFAVVPQAKPNAERDAYVADYMKKYPNDPFGKIGAELAYKADSNKAVQGAQKLVDATNPIAAIYRTDKALADVANKAINGETAKPYEVGQHYINKADEARQEFRDMTGNGLASDIALAAGDMLAGAATAGSLGVGLTPYLAATSGIQTAGEDINKGRELLPSVVHGVGSGGLTYLVGGLGGIGQTKLGQNLVGKITSVPAIKNAIETASPKVAKYLGDSIAKFIARAGAEAFEEWIEYPPQVLLENIVFDDAAPFDVKQWWNNTLVGGGVGGLFETSNIALNRLANAPVTRVQDGVQAETAQPNTTPVQMQAAQQRNESNQKDINYLTAIEAKDTSGAQAMVDDAAKEAGFKVKAWHGTPGKGFSSFDSDKIGTNTDDGIFGRGFYFTTNKGTADGYAKESGTTMPVFLRVNKPWWAVAKRNIQEVANELGMEESALTLKQYGGRGKIVAPILSQAGQFTAHLKEQGYDSVVVQHGANDYEIVIFDNDAIKLADPVIYDSNGKVVSLSERFKPTNTAKPVQQTLADRVGEDIRSKMAEYSEQMQAEAIQPPEGQELDTDLDESIESLMYDIDANEMARRARAAAKAPNEKTAELLSNTGNGIIESDSIDDSAQLLGKVSFAANKTISQVLDQAVRGSKGDLPLNKQQMQQLRNNLYNAIEKPLNEAKAKYINGIKSKAGSFAKEMARLGIKPGSKESAAVQWIGEGQRQGPDGEIIEYTLADLQQQFPNNWQNIVEASKICRNIYDAYVNEINDALKLVYPDVEARAAATMDKINARVAYNTNQAQIWLDKAAQLEQRLSAAQAETHSAESMAATKTTDRVNRLANQLETANQTVERYTRAAEAARAKAEDLQRMINSGEILRNKRLVPRKDYFHHFNEMEQGLGGFVNIISGAHDISAQLAGKSEFTKPKSKWWSALQQRTGGKYTEDAIGGMARYIPAAEYKIAFDPFIAQMRGNVEALVNATEKTKNANDLIEYLTDWTNDLAGKTNFLDRPIQKLFSRKSMKALEFLNNRAKANAVAGNLGSAIVQIGNIPNAMMFINNPADWASAAQDIATGNSKEGQSIFLNERYIGNTLDKLQKSSPIKDASNWMLEIGDRQAAKLIWNAAHNQFESGRAKGLRQYENAVDYADDITRRAIAGRGVGEMALTQKSRVIKLFAPFQVEVNNTYNLLVEKMGEKDAAALMSYAVGAWAINSLLYVITGRRALFDPIDALIDAIKGMRDEDEEDERTKGERVAGAISRVGGEVISNMPYASTAATFLTGTENSEKIFGEADPTRYGTGNIAVQTLTEPIGQFINGEKVDLLGPATAILPAYGGKQIERTVRGAQSLGYLPRVDISSSGVDVDRNEFGASRSASGRIRFPITEPADQFKTMLFGEWSTSRGKDYIDKGLQPLSANQSEAMEKAFAAGISPDTYYDALLAARKAVSQKDAKGETIKYSEDRDKIRLINEAVPGLTSKEYKLLFEALGISKNAY